MIIPSGGLQLALVSAALLGCRHGFDYDHIAAISDIASVQTAGKKAMHLGMLYALGHACTVAILGSVVIVFQLSLPRGIDRIAERLVGLTLVALGIYVLGSLFRGNYAPRSRFTLLVNALRWVHWKLTHWNLKSGGHENGPPGRPAAGRYDGRSAFTIGLVHGLGAETPSQLMIFLLAANLGGLTKGFLGLGVFLAGLLIMNTAMTVVAAGAFGLSSRLPRFQNTLAALTAIYS
ncbi:MAG TPA: hypothetical protein VNW97_02450, partial [Candidatus Saccharimonadales bacterium]|nr:hypothetical protein [Candidatus Saccharimonadales bacterium]